MFEGKIEWKTKSLYNTRDVIKVNENQLVFLCDSSHKDSWHTSDVFLYWWDIGNKEIIHTRSKIFAFDKEEKITLEDERCFYLRSNNSVFIFIDLVDNRSDSKTYKGTYFLSFDNKTKSIISRGSIDKEKLKLNKFACHNDKIIVYGNEFNNVLRIDSSGNISDLINNSDSYIECLLTIDEDLNCLFGFERNESGGIDLLKRNVKHQEIERIRIESLSVSFLENNHSSAYNYKFKKIAIYQEKENNIIIYDAISFTLIKTIPFPSQPNRKEDFGFHSLRFSPCNELLIITAYDAYEDVAFPHFCFSVPDFEEIDFLFPESLTTIKTSNKIITIGDDRDSNLYYNEHIIYWGNTNQKKEIIMKIVCLANSFRVGGRCLGGIELDQNNHPVILNGRPKWIRPVCNTEHEEVATDLVSHISLLDIVEFQSIQATGHGHQSENVLFNTNSIQTNGRLPISRLANITDNNRFNLVFGNRGAAVPEHKVGELNHSLMLLELTEFETNERVFENRQYPQIKLSFRHSGNLYNFPITDPSFLHRYGLNNNILQGRQRIYASLSLAAPHEEWSSKLVAGIIFDDVANVQPNNINDDDLPF
jgi:hypothetical protein